MTGITHTRIWNLHSHKHVTNSWWSTLAYFYRLLFCKVPDYMPFFSWWQAYDILF